MLISNHSCCVGGKILIESEKGGKIPGLYFRGGNTKYIFLLLNKTYVVGTQKNHLYVKTYE